MATKTRPGKWSINNKRNKVTVRVTFPDDTVMLFGTSYRSWWSQLQEYLRMAKHHAIKSLEVSSEPWVGFGGLKWCAPESLPGELDQEGKGRKIEDFNFEPASDWDWDRFTGDEFA